MGNATSGKSRGGTLATILSIGQTKAHRVVTKLSFSSLSPLFLSPSEWVGLFTYSVCQGQDLLLVMGTSM